MCKIRSSYQRLWALVVIIMLLSLATGGHAQAPEWLVYNTENSELPSNQVIGLTCDPRGAVWIGTQSDGLAIFDGEAWSVYNMANSRLPSNTIPALAFDAQGELWVGTGDGLGLFDGKNWYVFTTESTDLPYDAIHALAVDAGRELWIGTGNFYGEGGGGLAKFDKKIFTWARKKSFMMYNTKNSDLPGDQILSLAIDARGRLWVGTATGKVAMLDGNTWTVYTPENSELPAGSVPAIVCDTDGIVWMGTDGGGVARFDGTIWSVYTTENSGLPNNNVHALALDDQGILWVGTEMGLATFDGQTWAAYTPDNSGLPHEWVWALAPDMQRNLWIGTKDGLAVYREGGILSPEKASKIEDLVGIWEGWYMRSVAYRQFEADGTLKCAMKVEWLEEQDPSFLTYSGRFWFEGEVFKITASGQPATGAYEVWVRKKDGKTVHLSFHDMGDPDHLRAYDWGKGMTWVEP